MKQRCSVSLPSQCSLLPGLSPHSAANPHLKKLFFYFTCPPLTDLISSKPICYENVPVFILHSIDFPLPFEFFYELSDTTCFIKISSIPCTNLLDCVPGSVSFPANIRMIKIPHENQCLRLWGYCQLSVEGFINLFLW